MTTYREGQRVRIEWSDGRAVEGPLSDDLGVWIGNAAFYPGPEGAIRKVTILSEPRPEEPTGLGAVVEARTASNDQRRKWVLNDAWWWHSSGQAPRNRWMGLIDPVILSEGWKP